jgi:hypothetical protein
MHRFGKRDIGLDIEEQLGLKEATIEGKNASYADARGSNLILQVNVLPGE